MCFMIFESKRTSFYEIKTGRLKSGKIEIFPKGLVYGFGPKLAILPSFFLRNLRQENVFYNILQRKIVFLGYKTGS